MIRDCRDAGKELFGTAGMQDRMDSGLEVYRKLLMKDSGLEGYRKGGSRT